MADTFDFSSLNTDALRVADLSVGNTKNPKLTSVPGFTKSRDAITRAITPSFIPSQSGPSIADGFSGFGSKIHAGSQNKGNFKVKLVSILSLAQNSPSNITQVVFEVTPTISESGGVEYTSVQPIHMPGGIQVYKFTPSRTFEISAHFISRNTADALQNIQYLQTLRSWRMPFFGKSETKFKASNATNTSTPDSNIKSATNRIQTGNSGNQNVNLLGAPPEQLYFYSYSSSTNDKRPNQPGINLNRIPVVLTNLSISYPEEVDYIPIQLTPSANTEPFPIKMDVSITLMETHSPNEFEQFSLESYKKGTLKHF